LYLKLSNKLYGNDLSSVALPNDEGEEEAAPVSPPKKKSSITTDSDSDEEEVAPPKKQKTSIAPACPPKSEPYCIICMSPLYKEAAKPYSCKACKFEVCMDYFIRELERNDRKTYISGHCRCQEIILVDNFAEKLKIKNDKVLGVISFKLS
jgi:hypothetical protein